MARITMLAQRVVIASALVLGLLLTNPIVSLAAGYTPSMHG
jgi:hypothetical protein